MILRQVLGSVKKSSKQIYRHLLTTDIWRSDILDNVGHTECVFCLYVQILLSYDSEKEYEYWRYTESIFVMRSFTVSLKW